jgi:hypothetical protein
MRFRSKIDAWLIVLMVLTTTLALTLCLLPVANGAPRVALIPILVMTLVSALFVSLLAATHYTFVEASLQIRSGPFKWSIPLDQIRAIVPSRSLLSSPALSIDRLRIDFGQSRSIYISPADKEGFLREMRMRRPSLSPEHTRAR